MKILNVYKRKLRSNRDHRGDTIIEVLIAMAILTLVLGTAYVVSSNSLRTGTAAGQRNQALGYAQSQIEYIKQAVGTSNSTALNSYTTGIPFCLDPTGQYIAAPDSADPATNPCLNYESLGYNVRVFYGVTTNVFTVDVQWSGANLTDGKSKLELYYKIPAGVVPSPSPSPSPPSPPPPGGGGGGGACTIEAGWSVSPLTGGSIATFNAGLSHCSNGCYAGGAASGTIAWTGGGSGDNNIPHSGSLSLSPAGGYAYVHCSNDESSDEVSFNVVPSSSSPPSSSSCGGAQGNDGSPPQGSNPCVWYVTASRLNANQIQIRFRADHCRTSLSGNPSWSGSTRNGNGPDPEYSTVNVGSGSGTFSMLCTAEGYWGSNSTSFPAWSSSTPPPSPLPPAPPPPPPVPARELLFMDCHSGTYWEHWSQPPIHVNTGVADPGGCPT